MLTTPETFLNYLEEESRRADARCAEVADALMSPLSKKGWAIAPYPMHHGHLRLSKGAFSILFRVETAYEGGAFTWSTNHSTHWTGSPRDTAFIRKLLCSLERDYRKGTLKS